MTFVAARMLAAIAAVASLCPGQSSPTQTVILDETPTFRAESTLVSVPVVVRDGRGRVLSGLRQQDFELFDRGKPQTITRFSVEQRDATSSIRPPDFAPASRLGAPPVDRASIPPARPASSDRFIAYLIDDVHLRIGDLARVREAALRQAASALGPTDRVALFTTSSEGERDFTNDRDAFQSAIRKLAPHPIGHTGVAECPDISYYVADRIINHDDTEALSVVIAELGRCGQGGAGAAEAAVAMARVGLSNGARETRAAIAALRATVQRLSTAPGERVLVLVSPGFYAPEDPQQQNAILESAIRSKIAINALDPRGVAVSSTYDASKGAPIPSAADAKRRSYEFFTASADAEVLADLTSGSGGRLFRNSNDLDSGLRSSVSLPQTVYLLAFSPQNLKLDGSFHPLRVSVKRAAAVEARRGYYAPGRAGDNVETAEREIEQSVFSTEEMQEIPIELLTQFAKTGPSLAKITVLARVDVRYLRYRKEDGRNRNALTIVTALFDQMGKYVAGNRKNVDLRMRDESLAAGTPTQFKSEAIFSLRPAVYRVRTVVRDAEGRQMSAVNGVVDVPLID